MDFGLAVKKVKDFSVNILNAVDNRYVPQWGNKQNYIVVHYLGVPGQNHRISSDGTGAHFYVYWDGRIYQAISLDAVVWQVGTAGIYTQKHPEARNGNVIGIEMCPKCDGDSSKAEDPYWYFTEQTQIAAAALCVKLLKDRRLPSSHLLRHFDVVNKTCPAPYVQDNQYRQTWTWNFFVSVVKAVLEEKVEAFSVWKIGTGQKGLITTANLHVRTEPETGTVIRTVPKGTAVFPESRSEGGAFPDYWFKTSEGWMCGAYLYGWVYDKEVKKWWYLQEGRFLKKCWEKIDGLWYYFKEDGYLAVHSYIRAKGRYKFWWVDLQGVWNPEEDIDMTKWNVIEE